MRIILQRSVYDKGHIWPIFQFVILLFYMFMGWVSFAFILLDIYNRRFNGAAERIATRH